MVVTLLIISGLILGSFVNALVWRLHKLDELSQRKSKAAQTERAKLSIWHGRSMCPYCKHELAPNDLVPVLSWLWLRGKCRYCQKAISWQYPAIELLVAGLFCFSYSFWPVHLQGIEIFYFIIWLLIIVGFTALAVYDLRWFLLPNKIIYPLIILVLIEKVIGSINSKNLHQLIWSVLGAIVLGGLFYVVFQLSAGTWIGGGDVKLGVLLGLLAGGPIRSLLVLFLASVCGSLFALYMISRGKLKRQSHIPFGPYLIAGAIIVELFGTSLIDWYQRLLL